jgi:hypothetical protein
MSKKQRDHAFPSALEVKERGFCQHFTVPGCVLSQMYRIIKKKNVKWGFTGEKLTFAPHN